MKPRDVIVYSAVAEGAWFEHPIVRMSLTPTLDDEMEGERSALPGRVLWGRLGPGLGDDLMMISCRSQGPCRRGGGRAVDDPVAWLLGGAK